MELVWLRRKLLLFFGSLPFLILGSILLPVSIITPPMITLFSNYQQTIPHNETPNYYHYFYYRVMLSTSERAEFHFSSSQPVDFYILDQENFDRLVQNQTNTVTTFAYGELQNTHTFISTKTDTYVFMLLNTSGQDIVTITVRRSFIALEYVSLGVLVFGGVLMILGVVLKSRAVEIPSKVLEIIKMHGQIKVSELALTFSTSETDIELTLLKLRIMNQPIIYNPATREVSYKQPNEGPPSPAA